MGQSRVGSRQPCPLRRTASGQAVADETELMGHCFKTLRYINRIHIPESVRDSAGIMGCRSRTIIRTGRGACGGWSCRGRGWGGWQESSQIPGFPAQDPPSRHQGGREREDTKERFVEKDEGSVSTSEALEKEGKNH